MGTFIMKPTFVSSGGTPITSVIAAPPAVFEGWLLDSYPTQSLLSAIIAATGVPDLEAYVQDNGVGLFQDTLRFQFYGNSIYLDGSSDAISYSGLPSGFVLLSAKIVITIDTFSTNFGGLTEAWLQKDPGTETALIAGVNEFAYSMTFPAPTMQIIYTKGCGLRVNVTTTAHVNNFSQIGPIYNLRVEGTYSLEQFQATLETTNPVTTGDEITINSGGIGSIGFGSGVGNSVGSGAGVGLLLGGSPQTAAATYPPLNLLYASQLIIYYYDGSGVLQHILVPTTDFTIWKYNQIKFIMPNIATDHPKVVTIVYVDNGTQFSGSITLGSLYTIYFTDGTGIYFLNVGKPTDTLYVQGTDQVVEVEIPNPFIKTGFIP